MREKKRTCEGLTRRDFIKTVGMAGLASTGWEITRPCAAAEQTEPGNPTLPRRKLGKTGVEVSVLALGGMFDTVNNQSVLRQARNWGVNFWDTALVYGNGLSEEGYGRFLSRYPDARKDLFISTKITPRALDALTAELDKSLKRLNVECVDLFHIHCIEDFSQIADPKGFREWGSRIKRAGKIKLLGFTTHTNMEKCLIDAAKTDWIDAIMLTYNFRLMNTSKMKEAVAACAEKGIGLIAMKTQGSGPAKTESEAELQITARFLEKGFTDKQAKIKAVLENPNIASVCSQMPNLTILSANVAAARDMPSLSRSDFELLEKFAEETHHTYCAGCGSICSEAVGAAAPISDIMRCLMYYHDYGERDLAREVFAGLPGSRHGTLAGIDYSRAEKACPRKLAISKLMREACEILKGEG
ncbi:MAG TPA: aldo/keto reductase [Syntrophobacteraceae bacterium]|nr:aldo/keto reductase [Syntrophobacteraceae bacterium]